MSPDFGAMLNDSISDCTCAAYYHAMQIWSFNAGHKELKIPDSDVLRLYKRSCGYDPEDASTDQGGTAQGVLNYIHDHGLPQQPTNILMRHAQPQSHKLLAYFEVDHRNHEDIKRVIAECGVCYIGFNLPDNVLPQVAEPVPPKKWTYKPGAENIGGHAVVLVGYDPEWATFISWGELYQMTWQFFAAFVDECYALCDSTWIDLKGKTPFGMTMTELTSQMKALSALSQLKAIKAQLAT